MSDTKKQHFVPQFYLCHFAGPGDVLHAYNRKADKFYDTNPGDACEKNYLYEVRKEISSAGSSDPFFLKNDIEHQLSVVEGNLSELYKQLVRCCENGVYSGKEFLDGRLAACFLAAHLLVRHPEYLSRERARASEISSIFLSTNQLTRFDHQILELIGLGDNIDPLSEMAIMKTHLFSDDPSTPFNRLYNAFCDKRMTLFEAPALMRFVTTSYPFEFTNPDPDNYDFEAAYMPLSSKYAALFSVHTDTPQLRKLNEEGVKQINRRILSHNWTWDVVLSGAQYSLEAAVGKRKDGRPVA